MATRLNLPPPEPLEIYKNSSVNWKKFKLKWQNFSLATGLNEEAEGKQVATLLTIIGDDANAEYYKFQWAKSGDDKKITPVLNKFEEFCAGKKNVIYERYLFNTCSQQEGETIEQYVTQLRTLSENCEYADLEESLIRDRVVLGINNDKLREKLLHKPDLTLQRAIEDIQVYESTKKQMKQITDNSSQSSNIHAYNASRGHRNTRPKKPNEHKPQRGRRVPPSSNKKEECTRCGYKHNIEDKQKCPAHGERCHKCNGVNHFASQCRTKPNSASTRSHKQRPTKVNQVEESDEDYEEICTVKSTKPDKQVFAHLEIRSGGKQTRRIKFQVDTGASCDVISEQHLDKDTKAKMTPSKSDSILKMYNGSKIKPLGQTELKVINPANNKKYLLKNVTVIEEQLVPILGKKTAEHMDLVKVNYQNIDQIQPSQQNLLKLEEYPDVFEGVGSLPGKCHVQIDKSIPPENQPPRRVPVALRKPLKDKLDELEARGIISPITKHTPWVSNLCVVNRNNKLRICLDPKPLNKAIKRPHYQLPTIEDVATRLADAKIFSVLDAKDGFWQVELDQPSAELTAFHSPFGRYIWRRLPFGLSSSPEEFQRRIHEVLEGLEGVEVIADDILVFGKDVTEHDRNLRNLLERARERNLKLNKDKVKLRLTEVTYIGHRLTSNGLKPDPKKVEAIVNMPTPKDLPELRRFLGMVNYLSKFLPNLSTVTDSLRKLEEKDTVWCWEDHHDQAIAEVKKMITQEPVLKFYDVTQPVTLQCDASQTGLGATILQQGQPVAFASRSLRDTEQNYAQIEKEMLAIVYGCERFDQYLYGKEVSVESDHKPLETIMKKPLHKAPKRLQRMMLALQKYDLKVTYKPGRHLYIADTLSRAYINSDKEAKSYGEVRQVNDMQQKDPEEINLLKYLPISEERLSEIRQKTKEDPELQKLKQVIMIGWPETNTVPVEVKPYYNFRDELSVVDDILFKGTRVIIPKELIPDMKDRIHSSHMGQETCLRKAREAVYWTGMNKDMAEYIAKCKICNAHPRAQQKEEMKPHEVPPIPWSKVGTDIFELDGRLYLVTVDYFSNFWELDYLPEATTETVVGKLKSQFARHGIPEVVVSDNGPQFSSEKFQTFARKWEFDHITSSPTYPQSNGKAESAVKTAKHILIKAKADNRDPYLALLDYRNSPTQGSATSPVQKLMSRRTRTRLPTAAKLLKPEVPQAVEQEIKQKQTKQQRYYNQGAKNLKPLNIGDHVRIQPVGHDKRWKPATVTKKLNYRSYEVRQKLARC